MRYAYGGNFGKLAEYCADSLLERRTVLVCTPGEQTNLRHRLRE